jgi:UDP-glucose 4-epimerase
MLAGAPVAVFGDGSQTRDYTYVGDVASAALLAMDAGDGEAYNLGTGVETSVLDIVTALRPLLGYTPDVVFKPERTGEVAHISLDPGKVKHELGWEAQFDLEEGIKETLAYHRRAGC